MKKSVLFFLFLGCFLVAFFLWPMEEIRLFWQGQIFEFNLWGAVILGVGLLGLSKIVWGLWSLPRRFFMWRSLAHQKKAEEAWKLSLISFVQGDYPQAATFAEEAAKWPSLKAQALLIQLQCVPDFSPALLHNLKEKDPALASIFEDPVVGLSFFPNVFSLRVKAVQKLLEYGNVREALKEIQGLVPIDAEQQGQCRRLRAVLWLKAAEASGLMPYEKEEFLQDAWRADASWSWPALVYAQFLFEQGNKKRALKVLNSAWIHTADFKVLEALFEIKSLSSPLARLAEAQKLMTEHTPSWGNGWLVSLCLEAKLFGEAERLLHQVTPGLLKQVLNLRLSLLRAGENEPKDLHDLRDLLLQKSYSEPNEFK